ncbi:PEP-CTERM sorting domain-containing protein [Chitinimonas naiadis]
MLVRHVAAACAAVLLTSMGVAHADVTYTFNSGPVAVGVTQLGSDYVVSTNPAGFNIGNPFSASLTFASVLAPNSTIQLNAETGGYDFAGPANQGGVLAYATNSFPNYAITSNIAGYVSGQAGSLIDLVRYSVLDGSVTTDANGNIVAWDLSYYLFDDQGTGGFTIDSSTNVLTKGSLSTIDELLHISSGPGASVTIGNVVALNGQPHSGDYSFLGADTAFVDDGANQVRYYTQQAGRFAPVVTAVPEPGILALFGVALLAFVPWRRRQSR